MTEEYMKEYSQSIGAAYVYFRRRQACRAAVGSNLHIQALGSFDWGFWA